MQREQESDLTQGLGQQLAYGHGGHHPADKHQRVVQRRLKMNEKMREREDRQRG